MSLLRSLQSLTHAKMIVERLAYHLAIGRLQGCSVMCYAHKVKLLESIHKIIQLYYEHLRHDHIEKEHIGCSWPTT